MKHGPIAMIDSTFNNKSKGNIAILIWLKKLKIKIKIGLVLLIILNNDDYNDMALALSEVKARSAYTIVITDCK